MSDSDLRKAAQAALEALRMCVPMDGKHTEVDARFKALRAALAQPEPDDFNRGFQRGWERATKDRDRDAAARIAVEAKLAETIVSLAQPQAAPTFEAGVAAARAVAEAILVEASSAAHPDAEVWVRECIRRIDGLMSGPAIKPKECA